MADNVMHMSTMWVLDCYELQKATGVDWRRTEFGRLAGNGDYQHLVCDDEIVESLQEDIDHLIKEGCEHYSAYEVYKNTLAVIHYIRDHLGIKDAVLINIYW